MNLDGITLHVLTAELADSLQGGQISKIYQLHDRGLYFRIFNEEGPCHLIITLDGSPRLYLADNQPATPDVPTALAMFLRKYYENGRIASVSQLHLDAFTLHQLFTVCNNEGKPGNSLDAFICAADKEIYSQLSHRNIHASEAAHGIHNESLSRFFYHTGHRRNIIENP